MFSCSWFAVGTSGPCSRGGCLVEEAEDEREPPVGVELGHVEPGHDGLGAVGTEFPGEPGLVVVGIDRPGEAEGHPGELGLDSMECWWRDNLDAIVCMQPRSALWRFQKMLAGPEAMRFLLEADQAEDVNTKLARLVRKAIGAQWSQDVKVKFKQAELDNDDLQDLFIDVKVQAPATLTASR